MCFLSSASHTIVLGGDPLGYRILYADGGKKIKLPNKAISVNRRLLKWVVFSIVIILLVAISQSRAVRHFLLPGNGAVTEAALGDLVESLKDGEQVGEAVTAFCKHIIENAT